MLSYETYLDRVYGGFLGMNAGIRLGVPLEPNPWTYETIRTVFGNVDGYLSRFRRFAADDDANGPIYFVRALLDKLPRGEASSQPASPDCTQTAADLAGPDASLTLTPREAGNAWLEYTREGKGMFWWGGIGVSTEHTAYQNLLNGIPAPQSGSKAQNGSTMAEQIGGQIFVDSWGFICPGLPRQATRYAVAASSVSHDGEGLHGAAFIAACIAAAFTADSVDDIIRSGLAEIPSDSLYAAVVRDVLSFHQNHPEDWHPCMEHLLKHWGYDRYPGECHIIPNAGVCALALCYGEGDFARTIEIAVMCGWDTDCNAGSVGSIMGVFGGSDAIPDRYRRPMEDSLAASGISGYLNMVDMPSFARTLAHAGCRIAGIEEPADAAAFWTHPGELHYDFSLKGSTHGFRLSENTCTYLHRTVYEGSPCLEIDMERVFNGRGLCRVYHPMFYRREDFDDERYEPVFSPLAYSGQTLSFRVRSQRIDGGPFTLTPCLTTAMEPRLITAGPVTVTDEDWAAVTWQLPDLSGDWIHELGFLLDLPAGSCARFFMTDFSVTGGGSYRIAPSLQQPDFGQMTPFSLNACEMTVDRDSDCFCLTSSRGGAAFTGNYYARDISMTARIKCMPGSSVTGDSMPGGSMPSRPRSLDGACPAGLSDAGFTDAGLSDAGLPDAGLPDTGASSLYGYGLLLRARGARSFYFAGFQPDGSAAIGLCLDGQPRILARSGRRYALMRWHELAVLADGDRLSLTVDGQEHLDARDSTLASGMVGLGTGAGGSSLYREIEVSFSL